MPSARTVQRLKLSELRPSNFRVYPDTLPFESCAFERDRPTLGNSRQEARAGSAERRPMGVPSSLDEATPFSGRKEG
jgi:hypothetical protein